MKTIKLLRLIAVLFGSITGGSIWARGGHHGGHHHGGHHYGGFGLGLGYGLGYGYGGYWPYYGGYGYGGYDYDGGSPSVVYIQKEDGAQAPTGSQSNYWYYCRNPEGYYPHVKKCPNGWMKVVPQPPPTQ